MRRFAILWVALAACGSSNGTRNDGAPSTDASSTVADLADSDAADARGASPSSGGGPPDDAASAEAGFVDPDAAAVCHTTDAQPAPLVPQTPRMPGPDARPGGFARPPDTIGAFFHDLAWAMCEKRAACCPLASTDQQRALAECVRNAEEPFILESVRRNAEMRRGAVTIAADQMKACLEAIPAASCADLTSEVGPPACERAFTAQLPAGAPCDRHAQCMSGACFPALPGASRCLERPPCSWPNVAGAPKCTVDEYCSPRTGACTPLGESGGPCDPYLSNRPFVSDGGAPTCRDGLRCDPRSSRCVAPAVEGEPCVADCGPGFYCAFRGPFPRTCHRLAARGEACSGNNFPDECQPGLACDVIWEFDGTKAAGDATCRPPGGTGTACNRDSRCAPDQYCEMPVGPIYGPRVADPGPDTKTGPDGGGFDAPAAPTRDAGALDPRATKPAAIGRCVPRRPTGQCCSQGRQCGSGNYCTREGAPGRCERVQAEGEPCEVRSACAAGTMCVTAGGPYGTCRAPLPLLFPTTFGWPAFCRVPGLPGDDDDD